jgi:hypothetical protein
LDFLGLVCLIKKFKKLTDIGFVGFGFSGILDNDFWTIGFLAAFLAA